MRIGMNLSMGFVVLPTKGTKGSFLSSCSLCPSWDNLISFLLSLAVVHAEEGFGEFFGGDFRVVVFVEFVEVAFYEAGHGEFVSSGI